MNHDGMFSYIDNDTVALIRRMCTYSEADLQGVERLDLMNLMMLAGLGDTKAYFQMVLDSRDKFAISNDVFRCMIRLASAGETDPARMSPRPGRGRYRERPTSAPLVEERLVEDGTGVLRWEVRLTALGLAERAKTAAAEMVLSSGSN